MTTEDNPSPDRSLAEPGLTRIRSYNEFRIMLARTALVSALLASLTDAYNFAPDKTSTGRFLPFVQHRIPKSEAVDHVNLYVIFITKEMLLSCYLVS